MLTITLEPAPKGQITATSSDGHALTTHTPVLTFARYWAQKGMNPNMPIITVWSSGSTEWTLQSTVGYAASLIVEEGNKAPYFRKWSPFVDVKPTEAVSS